MGIQYSVQVVIQYLLLLIWKFWTFPDRRLRNTVSPSITYVYIYIYIYSLYWYRLLSLLILKSYLLTWSGFEEVKKKLSLIHGRVEDSTTLVNSLSPTMRYLVIHTHYTANNCPQTVLIFVICLNLAEACLHLNPRAISGHSTVAEAHLSLTVD